LAWLGSCAAVKMPRGRPGPRLVGADAMPGDRPRFLGWTTRNPLDCCGSCVVVAKRLRIAAILAARATRFFWQVARKLLKVLHTAFCHALCAWPQFTHNTLFLGQSMVWCVSAHMLHFAVFPQADWVWPHCPQLKHCRTCVPWSWRFWKI